MNCARTKKACVALEVEGSVYYNGNFLVILCPSYPPILLMY